MIAPNVSDQIALESVPLCPICGRAICMHESSELATAYGAQFLIHRDCNIKCVQTDKGEDDD